MLFKVSWKGNRLTTIFSLNVTKWSLFFKIFPLAVDILLPSVVLGSHFQKFYQLQIWRNQMKVSANKLFNLPSYIAKRKKKEKLKKCSDLNGMTSFANIQKCIDYLFLISIAATMILPVKYLLSIQKSAIKNILSWQQSFCWRFRHVTNWC